MKKFIPLFLALCAGSCTAFGSQNLVREYDWKELAQQHQLTCGKVDLVDGTWILKIENSGDKPLYAPILTITNPPISKEWFAVFCRIKYENVVRSNEKGNSQMQMSEDYSAGSFAQTFEFYGTSDWTDCILEGSLSGAYTKVPKLEISLALPGHGTVYLRNLQLIEYDKGDLPVFAATASRAWWPERTAGLLGGIAGSVIGCCGGLIGCLTGIGKGRRFVMGMTRTFIALGIVLIIAGSIAVMLQQPYAVYYPMLLLGVILTVVCGTNLRGIRQRYDDLEIRRMTSMDTTGR